MTEDSNTESLKVQYDNLRKEHERLKRQHEEVLGSTSWRATRPLRLGMRTVKPIGKRAKAGYKGLARLARRFHDAIKRRAVFWLSVAARKRDTLVVYRIIGNDLYPRHAKGQQYSNLKFILENEPELKDCQKIFIVNRIIDRGEERKVLSLLEEYGYEYIHIPFDAEEYRSIGWDLDWIPDEGVYGVDMLRLGPTNSSHALTRIYRLKNNYIMNNNGARNVALRDGKQRNARWILPWDGNCFITESGWDDIRRETKKAKYLKFFIVPMARETDNKNLLQADYRPKPESEPQIIFRADSKAEFNEDYSYGRRPKVELFWHLGIPGVWDKWNDYAWDVGRRSRSHEAGEFGYAGWVSRLYSGNSSQENEGLAALIDRGSARNQAITSTINYVDGLVHKRPNWDDLSNYDKKILDREVREFRAESNGNLKNIIDQLEGMAKESMSRGPYSVIDKTVVPPSGDRQDYYSVSPYAHPNPDTPDGLPYIKKDGQRVEGSELYETASEKYDRTRIQRVFDDSIALALAWRFTGIDDYAKQGANILNRFFIDKSTRMNPHMTYAQVWMGKNGSRGMGYGIIESKDMYYYLDAVRILYEAGALDDSQIADFKQWLTEYLEWLLESRQGKEVEMASRNNHATFYDMLVASIAKFIDNDKVLMETLVRARSRIGQQFTPDGSQPEELRRTLSQHYSYFNLQAWLILANIARQHGVDLWGHKGSNGASLQVAVNWLLEHSKDWQHEQIDDFDKDRISQLHHLAASLGYKTKPAVSKYDVKPLFPAHDGIRPYWNLGLPD